MSHHYHEIVTADSLIQENASCMPDLPEDTCYHNINYGMRTVLHYLVKYYDEKPDIAYACDHLAKLIAQVEER